MKKKKLNERQMGAPTSFSALDNARKHDAKPFGGIFEPSVNKESEKKESVKKESSDKPNKLSNGYQRKTYVLDNECVERIERVAYHRRKTRGEVIDEAIRFYLEHHPKYGKAVPKE